jgi:hypothetical protein
MAAGCLGVTGGAVPCAWCGSVGARSCRAVGMCPAREGSRPPSDAELQTRRTLPGGSVPARGGRAQLARARPLCRRGQKLIIRLAARALGRPAASSSRTRSIRMTKKLAPCRGPLLTGWSCQGAGSRCWTPSGLTRKPSMRRRQLPCMPAGVCASRGRAVKRCHPARIRSRQASI